MTSRAFESTCRRCWRLTDSKWKPSVSGKEALERVNKGERPDFIILDVLMPEMSGLDTLKEMMQADPHAQRHHAFVFERVGTVVEAIRIGAP